MTLWGRVAVLVAAASAVSVSATVVPGPGSRAGASSTGSVVGRDEPTLGPGTVTVRLRVRYSRFTPERVVVRPGTLVRFRIENRDPIGHELIVGPPEVHALHEAGTEHEHHGGGEVSVLPGARGVTTFRFDQPGRVVFACHLPGHLAYGMSGEIVVRGAPASDA